MDDQQGSDRFVSQTSFHDVLELLKENRVILRDQITALSGQLATLGREIKAKQDVTNGRVIVAEGDILEIKVGLDNVEGDVRKIKEKGCPLKEQHVQTLAALSAAGVVPVVTEAISTAATPPPPWQTTAKKAGKVGGWMGAGAIVLELAKLAQAWIQHLTQAAK